MKINKLHYKVYGKLTDYTIALSPGITIFFGDNEAGKSTIFNSIATLIYGFKPSNRERHPYVNWVRNEINFSSEIIESGELFTVERSLKSMPRLNILKASSHSAQLFRNEPLPFINHVSEALFESVFHITAEDLNQFEKASFESIQEKLIFNYGTDYLNKASDVIQLLEQDINALWRKDKRGNPKINQLQIEINQLMMLRHEAEKSYGAVSASMLRIEAIDVTLDRVASEKKALEQSVRQIRDDLPIKDLMMRIDTMRQSLYKCESYNTLDVKCIDKIEQNQNTRVESEMKAENRRIELEKLKENLFIYSEHDYKLINSKSDIESLRHALNDLMRLEQEEHSKLDELMKMREKIGSQYKILFNLEIDDGVKKQLKRLPVLDVMTLIQKYIEGSERNSEIHKRVVASQSDNKKGNYILGIVGIATFILGIVYEPLRPLSFVGMGLIGFSIANLKLKGRIELSESIDLTILRQKIDETCGVIQLPEYVFRDISLRFFGRLEQLILILHEEDALHEKWASLIERQKEIEEMISNVMQSKGLDISRGAALSLQYVLAQMERLAEIEVSEAKTRVKIESIEALIESATRERERFEAADNALREQVENFGDGDFEFGLKMIVQNTDLMRKIKIYSDELALMHYDAEAVLEVSDALLMEKEAQIADIDALEKQLIVERLHLSSDIKWHAERYNLEDINSQILVSEEQRNELIEQRNQLMVLLEIIKFSDERFRVENQPNIITRVSHFMSQMTQGKYQEVLVSEDNGHYELQFLIDGEIVPVARAFSKGTIQQLFFAYRLAVIEALDPQNQLPFLLDETFVNWDSKRFSETLRLLEDVSRERQIMVFTCHRNLAIQFAKCKMSKLIEVAT